MSKYSDFYKNFKEIESAAREIWKRDGKNYSDKAEITKIDEDCIRLEYTAHCWGDYQETYEVYNSEIDAYFSEKEKS